MATRLTPHARWFWRVLAATAILGVVARCGRPWFGVHALELPFVIAAALLLGWFAWWWRREVRAAEAERARRLERELWESTLPDAPRRE